MRIRQVSAPLLIVVLWIGTTPTEALAISADLAKKCQTMMVKQHPPHAAGSPQGSAKAEREFFKSCIARNGNMDPQPEPAAEPAPR
jgi:hypothetical protein